MQIITATRRLRSARLTIQSITEQDSAFDHDALARLHAALEDDLVALLVAEVDGARLERPRRGLDIDLAEVVLEDERAGRNHGDFLGRREERDIREHAGPQPRAR